MTKIFGATDSIHLMVLTHEAGRKKWVTLSDLTTRENTIVRLRMKGKTLCEICKKLGIHYCTGCKHIENLRKKYEVKNLRTAVARILAETQEKSGKKSKKSRARALATKRAVQLTLASKLTGDPCSAVEAVLRIEFAWDKAKFQYSLGIWASFFDDYCECFETQNASASLKSGQFLKLQ